MTVVPTQRAGVLTATGTDTHTRTGGAFKVQTLTGAAHTTNKRTLLCALVIKHPIFVRSRPNVTLTQTTISRAVLIAGVQCIRFTSAFSVIVN